MGKVLKADASSADAYLEQDLGSDQTEIWATASIYIDPDTLIAWGTDVGPDLAQMVAADDTSLADDAYIFSANWQTFWSAGGSTPTSGSWQLLEFHHVESGASDLYLDGVLAATGTDGSGVATRFVRIGQKGGDGPFTPSLVYFKDVKVGTTRGASDLFADDFSSGDLSAWTTSSGDVSVIDDPFAGFTRHVVTVKLFDLGDTELADISSIALEKTMRRRLNLPRAFTIQAPAGHSLLTTVAADGYPNLRKGNRKLVVWEDADPTTDPPIFCGRVWTVERTGDGTRNLVVFTAFDPLMELGYSEDQAGRVVRDDTGNFIDPTFAGTGSGGTDVISGGDLIQQILTNSQNTDPTLGEGPLPINTADGTFDLDIPPAIDLNPADRMTWPMMVGEFINLLVATGVVDVDIAPLNPVTATDPYHMGVLSAVNQQGADRSATVHFDYWTGSFNASQARHVEDFTTICNKLFDYLGPRIDVEHWRANIAPDSPGVVPDPTASRALYGGPGTDKGAFIAIRVYDSVGDEFSDRPLYLALYNGESGFRLEPRDMLFITPNPDAKALWEPPADYDVGDLVAVNTGGDFGIALAETQRVHGYDKSWDREGIARISGLITSADAE